VIDFDTYLTDALSDLLVYAGERSVAARAVGHITTKQTSNPAINPMKRNRISLLPWKYIALVSAAALSLGTTAQAAIQLDFVYNPVTGTTTATYFGTWDVGALETFENNEKHVTTPSNIKSWDAGDVAINYSGGINPGSGFVWGDSGAAVSSTGSVFGFDENVVYGPVGFTSDTEISGWMTWNKDLTAMGFDSDEIALGGGTYTGTAGTVNWTVSTAAVPEPSTYCLLSGGLVMGWVVSRRKRRSDNA
jgi:hypothetical protein